ncbi:hypothetical protein, partial [Aquidulcibacter sp.]|uniref:phage tail tip fiber protein n=1 Tax=Aquidulcibacter sp. TaxID=2052990 RepID=UPI0028AFE2A5
ASDSEIELRAARNGAASVGARITTEESARASGDSANASLITTLTARSYVKGNLVKGSRPNYDASDPNSLFSRFGYASRGLWNVGYSVYVDGPYLSQGLTSQTNYTWGGLATNAMPIAAGLPVSIQAILGKFGTWTTGTLQLQIYWYSDTAGNTFHSGGPSKNWESGIVVAGQNSGGRWVDIANAVAPSGVQSFRLGINTINATGDGSYTEGAAWMLKAEYGPTCTTWTDDALPVEIDARVTSVNSVAVDGRGRAYAISGTQTEVNGRKGGFVMDNDGVVTNFQITADDFRIYQSVGGSSIVPFRVFGGQTQINDALIRTLSVIPDGGGPSHRVQLRPNSLSGADGASFTFSPAYGGIPLIRPVVLQPPALAAGETYDISATSLSASGFTVRAKKFSAGTPTAQSSGAGSNVGGTPAWQAAKPTSADADGNSYTYSWTATLPRVSNEFMGSNQWYAEYEGEFDVYYDAGSGWVYAYSTYLSFASFYTGSSPFTVTGQAGATTAVLPAIGQHGGNEFGLHAISGTITAFAGVSYTTTSQSSVAALPGNFTFDIYPPT